MSAKISQLENILNYKFKDLELLKLALCHKSATQNNNPHGINNERLEFLGDSILSTACSDFLYKKNSYLSEGDLSMLRAQYVCKENLSVRAKNINLGDFLVSDKAMRCSGSNNSPSVLADTLEAIFGAVFIDGGFFESYKAILGVLGEPSLKVLDQEKDAKTKLQELVQADIHTAPKYILLESSGPAHLPNFTMGVTVNDKLLAKASGESKKTAMQNAAFLALKHYERA